MIFSSVFPVFGLLALGFGLSRRGLLDAAFRQTGDRLIYYVFFPVLLFWKIGGAAPGAAIPWRLWAVGLGAIFIVWILGLGIVILARIPRRQAGAFSQATYRFNTYVAMAVVFNAQGDGGAARLGELLAAVIPFCNVLAVATFIWFRSGSPDGRGRGALMLAALVRNPLVLACAAGMVWARTMPAWSLPVDNTLRLASSLTLPLALLSIGASLNFRALRGRFRATVGATLLKIAGLPLCGWLLLDRLQVTGPDRLTAMLFFAMPASTAMYVLATQMDGDAELSSAVIVLSTLLSLASLSAVLILSG